MVKVSPTRRFDVEVELRRRIKDAFEREHIPFSQRVVYLQAKTPS
jgi:small-conductance mechanosensitive channel